MCRPLEDVPSGYASVGCSVPASWPMMSSATLRRSESRWPQSTSRSSARRWPASSAASASISGSTARPRDERALQRDGVGDARGERRAVVGQRAQRAQASREAPGGGPLGLDQRAQREQDVGQRLAGDRALARHLVAAQRPGQLAAARRAPGDERAEGAQLVLLVGGDGDRLLAAAPEGAERERLPRRAARARPGQRPEADARAVVEAQRRQQPAQAHAGVGDRRRVARRRPPSARRRAGAGGRAPGAHRASAGASSGNASPCTSVSPSPSASSGEAISKPEQRRDDDGLRAPVVERRLDLARRRARGARG